MYCLLINPLLVRPTLVAPSSSDADPSRFIFLGCEYKHSHKTAEECRDTNSMYVALESGVLPFILIKCLDNRAILAEKSSDVDAEKRLAVAKRSLDATSELFIPISPESQELLISEGRIKVSALTQLDGQYILLVD